MSIEILDDKLLFSSNDHWQLNVLSIPYIGSFAEVKAERLSSLEKIGLTMVKVAHPEPTNLLRLLSVVATASTKRPSQIDPEDYLKAANSHRKLKSLSRLATTPPEEIAKAIMISNSSTRSGFLGFYPTYAATSNNKTILLIFATSYAVILIGDPWGIDREEIKGKVFTEISGRDRPSR